MRKRHQSLLISSQAKKKICNELSINNSSYEVEQKQILSNYFNNHIDEEDIEVTSTSKKADDKYLIKEKENIEEEEDEENEIEDLDDEDEENITLSTDIRVPPLGDQKGPYIKYEISEKAYVGGINFEDYSYIPENKLKIKENIDDNDKKKAKNYKKNEKNAKDKKEENKDEGNTTLKVGANINFNNIIEQMAYWAEEISYEKSKDKNKNKKKIKDVEIPDINIFQLFKLYPNKIDEISNKIKILEKEAKDKNLYTDNSLVKTLLNDQENIINEKKQNLGKLAKEVDRIHSITYGDNFSVIEFK